jgi:hypothetical protein
VVWRGASFARASDRIVVPQTTLDVEVGRAASAVAAAASRAVLDGDRYYEVVRPETEGDAWILARGRIEGRLASVPLVDSGRCSNLRIGARGRVVFLACVFAEDPEIIAELRRSTDGGTTWSAPLRLFTPDTDQIVVAVAPDGTALVTGVCRSSEVAGQCKLGAPLLVHEAILEGDSGADPRTLDAGGTSPPTPGLRALQSSAPQLSSTALAAAFGFDGRSAYFLGKRGKDERISLFVSHDGGETFAPRALQSAGVARVPRRHDDEEDPSDGDGPDPFEIDETSQLRPGDDGTVGIGALLRSRGSAAYLVTDDDGRLLQVGGPHWLWPACARGLLLRAGRRHQRPPLGVARRRRHLGQADHAPVDGARVLSQQHHDGHLRARGLPDRRGRVARRLGRRRRGGRGGEASGSALRRQPGRVRADRLRSVAGQPVGPHR